MQTERPPPHPGPEPISDAREAVAANVAPEIASRVIHSSALLAGRSQLAILHNETVYFLRQTRFGKLILTK
jgi:hemin uptake protein HemP